MYKVYLKDDKVVGEEFVEDSSFKQGKTIFNVVVGEKTDDVMTAVKDDAIEVGKTTRAELIDKHNGVVIDEKIKNKDK